MNWFPIPLGPLQTNCYVLHDEHRQCLIFDPGEEADKLKAILAEKKLRPVAILLTHAHFDHIGAVDPIRDHYNIPVYLHENEKKWLADPARNGSAYFLGGEVRVRDAEHLLKHEGEMELGGFSFEVFETPGHSPGSVTFYFAEKGIVVSGDTLFMGSVGRTDLPGGNEKELMKSIHTKLLELPEETIVLPGHGPVTTIGDEMAANPFLHGFRN
ncbi:MBL fold metallo-hydrolase [Neobacillus notoginsengisoli]|uniref:MBL fold metallo-hydrolase n=1 Tax=Neobacillus notoginsengisoli TaxID=1578198 RepID=A0A417YUW2_9BACI|nr:MBL fold metallo-hydrolase [Neobacillus notoginsengisoli]RHW41070.1 MBL fold metallo-hydrolase [Neobacillus notoginsengisoli]